MPRLLTLGRFELVETAAEARPLPVQPKRLALLAYLAASGPGIFHRRDELLALLWPELGTEEARRALRQALHYLRRQVGETCILTRSDDQVALAPGGIESDLADLQRFVAEERDAEALVLFRGPFLDAVHVPETSEEFEEWILRTRTRLTELAARAAWRLSEKLESSGELESAAQAARRAHELSPRDEAGLRRLLGVLVRMGDHTGALDAYEKFALHMPQHYRGSLSPETEALVRKIRSGPGEAAPVGARIRESGAVAGSEPASRVSLPPDRPPQPGRFRRPTFILGFAGILAFGIVVSTLLMTRGGSGDDRAPTLAVGWFENEAGDSMAGTVAVLRGMLATDLARVEQLAVVSDGRLLEILAQRQVEETRSSVTEAARRSGATELLEGTLYRAGKALRLDVRRVDLARGMVRDVYSAEESDPFALIGEVTTQVARSLALAPPATPLAGTGTGSVPARTLYEQGLRTFYRGDGPGGHNLFLAALAEDSTFAMAAYYAARSLQPGFPDSTRALAERAYRLAGRAPTRDRLVIRLVRTDQYAPRVAIVESLVARFPGEPDAWRELAGVRLEAGEFLAAIPFARRVILMDSSNLQATGVHCRACDAYGQLAEAYLSVDSSAAEERVAREFVARFPSSATPWYTLYGALARQGRGVEALAALRRSAALSPARPLFVELVAIALFQDDFGEAEGLLRARLREDQRDLNALWWLVFTLRQQGRLAEAEAVAERAVRQSGDEPWIWHLAQIRFERGHYREVARTFDSSAHRAEPQFVNWPGRAARVQSWTHTHAATAWAAAGDTARLGPIADTIEAVAHRSSYGRGWRLPHHVRGLLWQARGEHERAVAAFRAAIYSPTLGYTRTNLELARSLLALNRPSEAVAILRPALHGSLDASNLYVTRTELHELLGRAFEAAGRPDSAAAHFRIVVDSWSAGDPPFRVRADSARLRLRALGR